ncbi:hypothetical protein WMF28_09255 [Sorangium sp. So ce590]|uniref:hypothetical protein n=1 Tax=Sorangium sp. So ce590 TaxID=3133317 RepID=UPI003F5EE0B2
MKLSNVVSCAAAIAAFWSGPAVAASWFKVTFYGWPDNDPPGNGIANPVLHQGAGGIGTSDDPITVAVRQGRFRPGTRMYLPSLRKYLIVEDICASCGSEQIDIWMESDERFRDQVIACEEAWTPEGTVEVEIDPPPGRPVSTTPFFDKDRGRCNR